uniref:Uncharacterized protein n=1 Tax=Romanomermis culicivorax TaxID=13658 RepID=A0A915JQW1_ROMCU
MKRNRRGHHSNKSKKILAGCSAQKMYKIWFFEYYMTCSVSENLGSKDLTIFQDSIKAVRE